MTMAATEETKTDDQPRDELREYRVERYVEIGFPSPWAELLADAKNSQGFPVDWHFVRRAINNGLTHKELVNLLT
jgi:hypothetical protein